MTDKICPHCGVFDSEHDYEHLACECYPKQVERLRAQIVVYKGAIDTILLAANAAREHEQSENNNVIS